MPKSPQCSLLFKNIYYVVYLKRNKSNLLLTFSSVAKVFWKRIEALILWCSYGMCAILLNVIWNFPSNFQLINPSLPNPFLAAVVVALLLLWFISVLSGIRLGWCACFGVGLEEGAEWFERVFCCCSRERERERDAARQKAFNLDGSTDVKRRHITCHSCSLSLSRTLCLSPSLSLSATLAMTFNYDLHLWQTMQAARRKQQRHTATHLPQQRAACCKMMVWHAKNAILICCCLGM